MSAVAQPALTLRAKLARFFAPFALLFAPQVSSAARERRDMLVLLLAVTFVVIPHFEYLVWWATAVLVLLLVWRAFLTVTQRPIPSRLLMFPSADRRQCCGLSAVPHACGPTSGCDVPAASNGVEAARDARAARHIRRHLLIVLHFVDAVSQWPGNTRRRYGAACGDCPVLRID